MNFRRFIFSPMLISMSYAALDTSLLVVENFESSAWPNKNWVQVTSVHSGGYSTVSSAAWEGSRGLKSLNSGDWFLNTAISPGLPNEKLSMMVRSTSSDGRCYLGFDANEQGSKSLVFAKNTDSLYFQRNDDYQYQDIAAVPLSSISIGSWYKLEIEFVNATHVIGRLYDDLGTKVFGAVSATYPEGIQAHHISFRCFTQAEADFITLQPSWATDYVEDCIRKRVFRNNNRRKLAKGEKDKKKVDLPKVQHSYETYDAIGIVCKQEVFAVSPEKFENSTEKTNLRRPVIPDESSNGLK